MYARAARTISTKGEYLGGNNWNTYFVSENITEDIFEMM